MILLLCCMLNEAVSLSYEDDVDFGYFEGKYFVVSVLTNFWASPLSKNIKFS